MWLTRVTICPSRRNVTNRNSDPSPPVMQPLDEPSCDFSHPLLMPSSRNFRWDYSFRPLFTRCTSMLFLTSRSRMFSVLPVLCIQFRFIWQAGQRHPVVRGSLLVQSLVIKMAADTTGSVQTGGSALLRVEEHRCAPPNVLCKLRFPTSVVNTDAG